MSVSYTHLDVYKRQVYNSIREFGYKLKTTPIVFVGGGAVVMKNFGNHDAKNISYNLDVKANARGYAVSYTHLDVYKRQGRCR